MTVKEALDVVVKEFGVEGILKGQRSINGRQLRAMSIVKDAVMRYIKIQKEFGKLQDILKEKEQLSGMASIVLEDDNVRAES